LLDFLLKEALFFFLLAFRVFCKGGGNIGERGRRWHGWWALIEGFEGTGRIYLGPPCSEYPGGGDDHRCMDPQRAGLLDLLQHEAGHLAVVLEGSDR
jgi:hypothetical protein